MGEKIKNLSEINIGNTNFVIELNESYYEKGKYDIHLQCSKGRIALTDREFVQLASCFILAQKQFKHYKELDKDE